tara:strand:+ start:854 stop:1099 length:246 start_codon:yes stop_codon:yes gene_type:complete
MQLTQEEKDDFSNYREEQHILERHSEALYTAVELLIISMRSAMADESIHTIHLRHLNTSPLHKAYGDIRLDLYNKGLVNKP